ncbi:hypothetical protein SK128_025471, partial [Halocaridina rubra]
LNLEMNPFEDNVFILGSSDDDFVRYWYELHHCNGLDMSLIFRNGQLICHREILVMASSKLRLQISPETVGCNMEDMTVDEGLDLLRVLYKRAFYTPLYKLQRLLDVLKSLDIDYPKIKLIPGIGRDLNDICSSSAHWQVRLYKEIVNHEERTASLELRENVHILGSYDNEIEAAWTMYLANTDLDYTIHCRNGKVKCHHWMMKKYSKNYTPQIQANLPLVHLPTLTVDDALALLKVIYKRNFCLPLHKFPRFATVLDSYQVERPVVELLPLNNNCR